MRHVGKRLTGLGAERVRKVLAVGREGGPDLISGELLLAIGIRESGLMNVLGDFTLDGKVSSPDEPRAVGHARGAFQIHDAFHSEALARVPGCRAARTLAAHTSSAWIPVAAAKAVDRGFCPTVEDGARIAARILTGLIGQADASSIARDDQVRVAVAAYNCGFGGALSSYRRGDADLATTGRDYSRDVLLRRSEIREWLDAHSNWRKA